MSEFVCEVVRLPKFSRHPNADTLNIVSIWGYTTVFSDDNNFKEGDLVVYVPVDAMVPMKAEWEFLGTSANSHRIKAKKLRGIFSQGLLIKAPEGAQVGQDVAAQLGITKYEEPEQEEESLQSSNSSHPGYYRATSWWQRALPNRLRKYLYLWFGLGKREASTEKCPFFFPMYTDIENVLGKYGKALPEGEEVILVEKSHGCLYYDTRISMANFSKKPIYRIVQESLVGQEVLGVDATGNIVPTKITHVFDNGYSRDWLKISGSRLNSGRGGNKFSVKCTNNHKFWNGNDYVRADGLSAGDSIYTIRTDYSLTPLQTQILIGKLLGDGCLSIYRELGIVRYGHKLDHKEYVEWTNRGLGNLANIELGSATSGFGTSMVRGCTVLSNLIKTKFESFISKETGKKYVPEWVVNEITPISLAFWYMDDGSLDHDAGQEDRARFAVCGFSEKDCLLLIKALDKFNIKGFFYTDKGGYRRIRLNADEAEKLFILIVPYITKCMQYKLPERYRGFQAWLPEDASLFYKQPLVEQKIEKIEKLDRKHQRKRFDLETETHNYFANGVLVHNCNSRFVFSHTPPKHLSWWARRSWKPRLWVGSHGQIKAKTKKGKGNYWWQVAETYQLAERLQPYPDLVFFGEIYGWNVQDLKYNAQPDQLFFRVFDIFDLKGGRYLDYDACCQIVETAKLEMMPTLHRGPWNLETLRGLAEKDSQLAPGQLMEGFVVRPTREKVDEHGNRLIFKYISQRYRLRKGGTEKH